MATKKTYYLHLNEFDIVIAYHSDLFDKDNLAKGERLIEISTTEPERYLGLSGNEIFMNPLPEAPTDNNYADTLEGQRSRLKNLYFEIMFTREINENFGQLQEEYDRLIVLYDNQKNNK